MFRLTDSELIDELKKRLDEKEKALNVIELVNRKLENVNKKLHESERLKSNFLSNIRNEINNPLTSMLCFSKALMTGDHLTHERISCLANSMYSETFNLGLQFRNIFAAAETEAGEAVLSVSRVDIAKLIKSTIELFSEKACSKGINIVCDLLWGTTDSPHVITDPEKLQLIIINLLSNAIEFSNENGPVELRAWKYKHALSIGVKDYGQGIDKQDHEIIFDRFKQLDSGSAKSHLGHGLGLSVTKALVEMLNGTISVESERGRGATFTILIPDTAVEDQTDVFSGNGNEFIFEETGEREF